MKPAKAGVPATFGNYDEAVERVNLGQAAGIGFELHDSDGYCGVDLDHVIEDGRLTSEAQEIVDLLDSYTEVSPSGKGLRIFVKAHGLKFERNKKGFVEVYSCKRYLTVTGNVFGQPKPINERTSELAGVYNKYLAPIQTTTVQQTAQNTTAVIEKIMHSPNREKFDTLYSKGDWQSEYTSQSEADLALCNLLAYWTNCDLNLMDAIFRRSKLMRPKWDEQRGTETYGTITLKKAVADFTNFKQQSTAAIAVQKSVKPYDYSDSGNAEIFVRVYKDTIIYVKSIGWLVWDGKKWVDNDLLATDMSIALTEKMLTEAVAALNFAKISEAQAIASQFPPMMADAKEAVDKAKAFHRHVLKSRNESGIKAMLNLARTKLHKELNQLDADPFLLNTPAGMVDLTTGMIHPHDSSRLCTKITAVSPGTDGQQMWYDFLEWVTCNDKAFQDFLQIVDGMSAIGKVYQESIIMAFGGGGNGKSTKFNPVSRVLGSYSGTVKPEVLMRNNGNKSADLATLKGKRLIIAAELEEGEYLSSSMLKRIVSTDEITAERKYYDPESFMPSHTLILYYMNQTKTLEIRDRILPERVIL